MKKIVICEEFKGGINLTTDELKEFRKLFFNYLVVGKLYQFYTRDTLIHFFYYYIAYNSSDPSAMIPKIWVYDDSYFDSSQDRVIKEMEPLNLIFLGFEKINETTTIPKFLYGKKIVTIRANVDSFYIV